MINKMIQIRLSESETNKYTEMYEKLENMKCPCCKKDMGKKEISLDDFMLWQYLRERYY
jgi:hypothetical protein